MQLIETRGQRITLRTKLQDVTERYEAFIEKIRARKSADSLATALVQNLTPRKVAHSNTTIYTAHLTLSGNRRVAVELFHTKGTKVTKTNRNTSAYDRINYWEKGMGPGLVRAIEFRPDGLYTYQAQSPSDREPLTIKRIARATFLRAEPAQLRTLQHDSWVPFDAKRQSQVYCEIANLFIEAQKAIEVPRSLGQSK